MIVFYGKAKVGLANQKLCTLLGKPCILMDDEDRDDAVLESAEAIIPTPGIAQTHSLYTTFGEKIVAELDFCWRVMREQEIKPFTIGITGTDGKSTVTWIIAQALEKLLPERHIHIPGNFDLPMSEVVYDIITKNQQGENHVFVTECSSFMLYPMHEYQFTVGVWTNFAPDHLNWHPDMKQYFAAKQHLIANSQVSFIHNSVGDQLDQTLSNKTHLYPETYDLSDTHFVGAHNEKNCALSHEAIRACLKIMGMPMTDEQIHAAIATVYPLKHRLQPVKVMNGVTRYDDGKSTSAQALSAALTSFAEPIIIICGGSDKGDSFGGLGPIFARNCAYGVFLGQTAAQFASIFETLGIPYSIEPSIVDVVKKAREKAQEYDAKKIVFSPGCASFDMFKNYEDRAHQFVAAIENL